MTSCEGIWNQFWKQHEAVKAETAMQQDGEEKDGRDQDQASASQFPARGILKKESVLNKGKE